MANFIKANTEYSSIDTTAGAVAITLDAVVGKTYQLVNSGTSGNLLVITYGSSIKNLSDGEDTSIMYDGSIWMLVDTTEIVKSTGLNIDDGEFAIFASSSGLAIKSGNGAGIPSWGSGTNYTTAGTLARVEGRTYASTGVAGNLNKDPRLPENAPYWFTPPDDGMIEYLCSQGDPLNGGMHTINDRGGANYVQRMKINSKAFNSIAYDYWMVHLDDTQITGVTELENIFNVGAANQYPYLDKYAPDVLGTRTLIDHGEYVDTPQSSGGENDVLGEVLEDRFQKHYFDAPRNTSATPVIGGGVTAFIKTNIASGTQTISDIVGASGFGTPRIGLTTRPKEFTVGASYIIVKTPA